MKIQQIRNATVKLTYGDKTFLIDPIFAPKDIYPPIEGSHIPGRRWPMTELPLDIEDILSDIDAVIITHCHIDHFDNFAAKALKRHIKIFAQDEIDSREIAKYGFSDIEILPTCGLSFGNVELFKTGCCHGIKEKTLPYFNQVGIRYESMGVCFKADGEKTLYLAGDTIWCNHVKEAIGKFNPEIAILNCADARIGESGSIIMGKDDIMEFHKYAPNILMIASHMDSVGHATLDRKELSEFVNKHGLDKVVMIPSDGQILTL